MSSRLIRFHRYVLDNAVYHTDPSAWRVFEHLLSVCSSQKDSYRLFRNRDADFLGMNRRTFHDVLHRLEKIYDMIELITEETPKMVKDRDRPVENSSKSGFMYLIRNSHGSTKIGISVNPAKRLRQLESITGDELLIVHIVRVFDMRTVESWFHQTFDHRRLRGEWFNLTSEDTDTIQQYKSISKEDYAHFSDPNHPGR